MGRHQVSGAPYGPMHGVTKLWLMLLDTCTAFNMLQHCWPVGHTLQDSSPLYPALHSLMLFLLPLTCPSSDPRFWASPLGHAVTPEEAFTLITPVILSLCNICKDQSSATLPASIRSLPPGYISMLCCLACYGSPSNPQQRLCPSLYGWPPASLSAPRELRAPTSTATSLPSVPPRSCRACKTWVPGPAGSPRGAGVLCPTAACLVSYSDQCSTQIAASATGSRGATLPALPEMCPSVTTPEHAVLRIICKATVNEDKFFTNNCPLMMAMMQEWPSITGLDLRSSALEDINSLLHIARFCSACILGWMEGLQERRLLQRQQPQHGTFPARLESAAALKAVRLYLHWIR